MDKCVAITGCNGYIGGQTVLKFKDLGYHIVGVDRNTTAPRIRDTVDTFITGDFTNPIFINSIINKNPSALIHIAGTSLVGPSMTDPGPYYLNNVDAVTDEQILQAYRMLADKEGFFVEPSSAASVAGLLQQAQRGLVDAGSTIVCTVTGNGLKDTQWALEDARDPVLIPIDVKAAAAVLGLA